MITTEAEGKKPIKDVYTLDHAKDTGMAVVLVGLIVWLRTKATIAVIISLCILLLTMTFPLVLMPAARLWFGFSRILGMVTSKIVLSLVFFTVVVPVGAVRKWAGKDTLQLNGFGKQGKSGFIDRNHRYTPDDLLKPF
jgi:hypothetical protein